MNGSEDKIIIGKQLAGLIEGDVGQLAVFIGVLMHGLLDQLTEITEAFPPLLSRQYTLKICGPLSVFTTRRS